jgi:hypothetical protein
MPTFTRKTVQCTAVAFLTATLLVGGSPTPGRCDEPEFKLPKDGSWVRYEPISDREEKPLGRPVSGSLRRVLTVTVSLVGTVVEDGMQCRWLEIKTVSVDAHEYAESKEKAEAQGRVEKFLIPEKDLISSQKPFENVRRIWDTLPGRTEVRQMKFPNMQYRADHLARFWFWTPGMLKDTKPAPNEAKDVEYKKGKLQNAEAQSGQRDTLVGAISPNGRDNRRSFVESFTVWMHPDVPIGFAEARFESQQVDREDETKKIGTPSAFSYRIQDFGSDAKSELPDNK